MKKTQENPVAVDMPALLLREASRTYPPQYIGKSWSATNKKLEEHYKLLQRWTNGTAYQSFYLLDSGLFPLKNGKSMDLVLRLEAYSSDAEPFLRATVSDADVALVVRLDMPRKQVLDEGLFPKGSLFELALDEGCMHNAWDWPQVVDVIAYYDVLGMFLSQHGWDDPRPFGFEITVRLTTPGSKVPLHQLGMQIETGAYSPAFDEDQADKKHYDPGNEKLRMSWPSSGFGGDWLAN